MKNPTMFETIQVHQDTFTLNAYMPVPGFGVLPVNAFLIKGQQPVLVDTGLFYLAEAFQEKLFSLIDPKNLHWIWITHTDADHLGNLQAILDVAPNARLVTTYLGMGKMNMLGIPLDRVYLLNPGQELDLGDRRIQAVSPPTYDAPETCGLFDHKTGTLFSADSFGALMKEPTESAAQIAPSALREGCIIWTNIDAPWLGYTDDRKYEEELRSIEQLDPRVILSSHRATCPVQLS